MTGSEVMDLLCHGRIVGQLSRAIYSFVEHTFFPSLPLFFRETPTTNAAPAPGNPQKSAMQSTTNSFPSVHPSVYEYTDVVLSDFTIV